MCTEVSSQKPERSQKFIQNCLNSLFFQAYPGHNDHMPHQTRDPAREWVLNSRGKPVGINGPWSISSEKPAGDLRTRDLQGAARAIQESTILPLYTRYYELSLPTHGHFRYGLDLPFSREEGLISAVAMELSRELLGGLEPSPQLWHKACPRWQLFSEVCQLVLMHRENLEFPLQNIWSLLNVHPRSPGSLGLQIGPVHYNTPLRYMCRKQTLSPLNTFIQGNNHFGQVLVWE